MQKKDNPKPSMDKNERKRGRPSGRNRVPLSLEERRARNAQYERERRNETADAMAQLAAAAGCDPQISNPELLATVINRLQTSQSDSIETLKRINNDLESQIVALQSRLESDPGFQEDVTSEDNKRITSQSDSNTTTRSIKDHRPSKYRKTSKRNNVHDGAIPADQSSNQLESSTDSQYSDWSNHHTGKTVPQARYYNQPPPITEQEYDIPTTSRLRMESTSSALSKASSIEEFHSEYSNSYEEFPGTSQNVDNSSLPNLMQNQSSPKNQTSRGSPPEEPTLFRNPFTDREKAILAKMGWSDFIIQGPYNENQSRWTVDTSGY